MSDEEIDAAIAKSETLATYSGPTLAAVIKRLKGERASLSESLRAAREALEDLLRLHDWIVLAGGRKGPLPQDTIEKFAEMLIPSIDKARAAMEAK